ncbi:MAG: hypothetical protein KJ638_12215, partial [Chloroflexi bacterium]|nr:hypothetical protein [Chloroflexota bacterium]
MAAILSMVTKAHFGSTEIGRGRVRNNADKEPNKKICNRQEYLKQHVIANGTQWNAAISISLRRRLLRRKSWLAMTYVQVFVDQYT